MAENAPILAGGKTLADMIDADFPQMGEITESTRSAHVNHMIRIGVLAPEYRGIYDREIAGKHSTPGRGKRLMNYISRAYTAIMPA